MIRLKKFRNMQGYRIAENMMIDLKRSYPKSDIHQYMALAELLGLVDSKTAQFITQLSDNRTLGMIRQEASDEKHRRETNAFAKLNDKAEPEPDNLQKWSDVM